MKKQVLFVVVCCLFFLMPFVSKEALAKEGTLLVAFGTTMDVAKPAIDGIENAFKKVNGDKPLLMAYTSDIIRNKLAKKGKPVLSVTAALIQLAKDGVTDLTVQSLHVLPAEEYMQLERMIIKFITQNPNAFKTIKTGYPMLVSKQDLDSVVQAVINALPKERTKDEAVLLMAHGNNRGPGDIELLAVNNAFQKADANIWLAAVEGAVTFDDVVAELKANGIKRVWLQPFMIVAGDHARNDLVGSEDDSWASQLQALGMETRPHLLGLGELEAIQQLFLRHADEAVVDLANLKKAD